MGWADNCRQFIPCLCLFKWHSTVDKQNLSGFWTGSPTFSLYESLVTGRARASVSGAPLYHRRYTSITASLPNRCDKLPQKPALFLSVQCCRCCIFEDWQLFRGMQDKGNLQSKNTLPSVTLEGGGGGQDLGLRGRGKREFLKCAISMFTDIKSVQKVGAFIWHQLPSHL